MKAQKQRTIPGMSRLLWGFPVLALVLVNAIWLLPSLRDIAETNSKFRLEVAGRATDSMRMFVDAKVQALQSAADRLRFEREDQKMHLERILKEHREFDSVSILEEQGNELMRVSRFEIVLPEDLAERYDSFSYETVSSIGVFYGPVTRTTALEPVMNVAVPIVFGIDSERGILVGELNLKQLSSAIDKFRFGSTGKVYVVDKAGVLIIDPDISLVLKSPDLRDRSVVQAPEKHRTVAQARYLNENNVLVEASAVFLSSLSWQVIAEQSVAEANVSRNRILALALLSGGLGVALLLLLVANNTKLLRVNESLAERNRESDETAKILVRKDRSLTLANLELGQLARDLEEAGKMLVRRDMELTQSNERLRDLDVIKSQFVSVAAHQLRTPLAGIKWTLYSLLEERVGNLNVKQRKFAGDAYTSALRLIELVNDLLDAARLEEGRFGFLMKKQDFLPVARRAYERFTGAAKEKGIAFSFKASKEALPQLKFDEEKIAIALDNVLDNAIKYTSPGGNVTVTVAKEDNRVVCQVQDTGIGMPENQTSKVFTKFFRAENAQLLQTDGTGLGLYLVKNIVEHHKGSVFFTSKENKGSTFAFTLPIPEPL